MAVLRALKGLNPGQVFSLDGDRIVLGRHPDCDIVLEVGAVSRQHAQILKIGDDYYVEDLHSRNGTFVNEHLVRGRRKLADNEQVRICDLVFVFHGGAPEVMISSRGPDDTRTMIFDERPAGGSSIMSKLDVSTGRDGLRLAVNPEVKLKALLQIGQDLGKALESGNLSDAKEALEQLQTNAPAQAKNNSNPMSAKMEALSKAVESGDLKAAQEAYADIKKTMSQRPSGGGGRAGGAGGPPPGGGVPPSGAGKSSDTSETSDSSKVYDPKDANKDGTVSWKEEQDYNLKHPEKADKTPTTLKMDSDRGVLDALA